MNESERSDGKRKIPLSFYGAEVARNLQECVDDAHKSCDDAHDAYVRAIRESCAEDKLKKLRRNYEDNIKIYDHVNSAIDSARDMQVRMDGMAKTYQDLRNQMLGTGNEVNKTSDQASDTGSNDGSELSSFTTSSNVLEVVNHARSVSYISSFIEQEVEKNGANTEENNKYAREMKIKSDKALEQACSIASRAKEKGVEYDPAKLDELPNQFLNDVQKKIGTAPQPRKEEYDVHEFREIHCSGTDEYAILVNASQSSVEQLDLKDALRKLRKTQELSDFFGIFGYAKHYINKDKNVYVTCYTRGESAVDAFIAQIDEEDLSMKGRKQRSKTKI